MRILAYSCCLAFCVSMTFVSDDPVTSHLFAFSGGVWLMNLIDAATDWNRG